MLLTYLLAFSRITVGLVFGISFIGKALDVPKFEQTITNFDILPARLSTISALLFLSSELTVVILLIVGGKFLGLGFVLAIFILLIFCIALVSVLVRNIQISCNCFGSTEKLISPYDVWRNVGFILCALLGRGGVSTYSKPADLSLAELGILGLVASTFVVLLTHLGDIFDLFRTA